MSKVLLIVPAKYFWLLKVSIHQFPVAICISVVHTSFTGIKCFCLTTTSTTLPGCLLVDRSTIVLVPTLCVMTDDCTYGIFLSKAFICSLIGWVQMILNIDNHQVATKEHA
jgi:hypothetical protein